MNKIEHKTINNVELKLCSVCKEWKVLSCFCRCERAWDNLYSTCKGCKKQKANQYYIKNTKKINQRVKQYRIDNPEKIKQYRIEHVEKAKQYAKQYNIEHFKEIKQYCMEHVEERKQHYKKYCLKHRKEINQRAKQYRKKYKAQRTANQAKREATKLNQTPLDANLKEIQFIYDVCAETNELLGGTYFHVDHIQPLAKGGLHHEDNLQILEATLNMEKNAKWPLTAGEEIRYKGVKHNDW